VCEDRSQIMSLLRREKDLESAFLKKMEGIREPADSQSGEALVGQSVRVGSRCKKEGDERRRRVKSSEMQSRPTSCGKKD
jgi:hypothetical protein